MQGHCLNFVEVARGRGPLATRRPFLLPTCRTPRSSRSYQWPLRLTEYCSQAHVRESTRWCTKVYWLSGLTCTDENFSQKAGAFQAACDNQAGHCLPKKRVARPSRGISKIRGTFLGVPIILFIVFWGLYWGSPILGNYQQYCGGCPGDAGHIAAGRWRAR